MTTKERDLPEGMARRGRTYYTDFYANGKRVRKRLSNTLDTAKRMLRVLQTRAELSPFGLTDNNAKVADVRKAYERHCRQVLRPGTVQRQKYSLDAIIPAMPANVSAIGEDAIEAYRGRRLAEGICPRTVNLDVQALSGMLTWAAETKPPLIGSNPIRGLKRLRHDRPKKGRPFEPEEIQALLAASPEPWRSAWLALATTGMRKGELSALRFSDIDWANAELIVRPDVAKTHNGRRIPIDRGLMEILRRQLAARDLRQPGIGRTPEITARVRDRFTRDHVFVTTQNTPLDHGSGLYYALLRCCLKAGIETRTYDDDGQLVAHIDVHSFRSTFITEAIIRGADPKSVQAIVGHKTVEITLNVYARTRRGTLRDAVGRLSYGSGSQTPEGVIEFPAGGARGHKLVTSQPAAGRRRRKSL